MNHKIFQDNSIDVTGKVLALSEFRPFLDAPNGFQINEEYNESLIKRAEGLLTKEYPCLIASDYMMFKRDGNRSIYEGKYFPRRGDLLNLAIAEYIEKKGRFTDKVIDVLWLILEETTWVVPAHNPSKPEQVCPLPYAYQGKVDYIDLFSATTAATVAWVYYLLKDELNKVTPIICERVLFELNRRIIDPYMDTACENKMWWMGVRGNTVNNWNPWILSNILTVCALTVEDTELREKLVARVLPMLDNFTKIYHDDGGCDEGPSYWGAAGASLFDNLQIIYDMTGGTVDLFSDPLVKNMGEYEVKACINGNRFLNFADCPARVNPDPALLLRWGKLSNSEMMYTYGSSRLNGGLSGIGANSSQPYRFMRNMSDTRYKVEKFVAPTKFWLDGIVIAGSRETSDTDKGLFLAFKGGNNNESHNHNDVGTVTVFADGQPIFLDAGSGRYTRRTFSKERYTIWAMRSDYHNCATVNGIIESTGSQAHSCDHVYDEKSGGLSMQLKNAYPEEANIDSYIRNAVLENGKITITDTFELKDDGNVMFSFICNMNPENVTENSFEVHGRRIEFDPKLKYASEALDKTWPEVAGIPGGWDCEYLYRVTLTTKNKFKNKKFVLTVN